ncbi:uncharacterized protein LOC128987911 [Macrosteles quadrilineatus]|uniref:uncharacterized protein LOC128987911 n=1 Tax=Macrosteles quadrilineatus TaxID=74068 RepID=UPI0023E1F715|nr:uncharacterized protein LOC128987911 [Macrosteles quadrilineatus]
MANNDQDKDDPVAPLQPNVTYYRCTLSSPTVEGLQVHEIQPYSVDPLQPDVAAHFHLAVSGNGELQLREIWRLNRGEYPRTGQRYPPILVTADEPHYMIQWLDDSGYVSYIDVNNNEVFL